MLGLATRSRLAAVARGFRAATRRGVTAATQYFQLLQQKAAAQEGWEPLLVLTAVPAAAVRVPPHHPADREPPDKDMPEEREREQTGSTKPAVAVAEQAQLAATLLALRAGREVAGSPHPSLDRPSLMRAAAVVGLLVAEAAALVALAVAALAELLAVVSADQLIRVLEAVARVFLEALPAVPAS